MPADGLPPTEFFGGATTHPDSSGTEPEPQLGLEDARRVNTTCERFENDWREGKSPRIEEYLDGWVGPPRTKLLNELVALELDLNREAHLTPSLAEYHARFPADAEAIAAFVGRLETIGGTPTDDPGLTCLHPRRNSLPDTTTGLPQVFGDYELIKEVGRGGMGVVFKAWQRSLKRDVALKMILAGPYASPLETKRFQLEAELAANLDHPNIVPIHDVGDCEGRVYFTMKLVDGGSLAGQVQRLVSDPRAAARLVETVARAVHHAHRHGFLHCDLKPANILLDADGVPHVTDFGLARRVEGESTLTASGALMGTPSYMAPEQASGERKALTAAADVYALGAILYELLTGRPPFQAPTVMETVVQVLEREPPPPSSVRPGVPRGLEAICLKCLEKAPRERFVSAAELAENLGQYLRGESVTGSSVAQRLRRWARREPELVAHVGTLALVSALTEWNYYHSPVPELRLHLSVQSTIGLWVCVSLLFQALLRRGGAWTDVTRMAWAATDVLALTRLLFILQAFNSDLVVAYPLLIAASGLFFRERLVWFTTACCVAGYLALYQIYGNPLRVGETLHYSNIFVASLVATGYVVARQVKRIWALSTYYENRPGGG